MSFWDFPVKYKFSHNFIRDPKKKMISWGFGDAFDRICSVESIPILWLQKEHTQVHLREIINTSMSYKTLTTSHALSFLATWWPVINRSNQCDINFWHFSNGHKYFCIALSTLSGGRPLIDWLNVSEDVHSIRFWIESQKLSRISGRNPSTS